MLCLQTRYCRIRRNGKNELLYPLRSEKCKGGEIAMIQFCIGILVGFAIAAMVQVGKRSDEEMGCDDELQSKK